MTLYQSGICGSSQKNRKGPKPAQADFGSLYSVVIADTMQTDLYNQIPLLKSVCRFPFPTQSAWM